MTRRLEPSLLRELLSYDMFSGKLYWKHREQKWFKTLKNWKRWNTRHAGLPAFNHLADNGYYTGTILWMANKAHRIIFAMCYNYWPDEVDHIDGNRQNNKFINLRNVDDKENAQNAAIRKDNKSGVIGVRWKKESNKWVAYIRANGKQTHLGFYFNFDDAVKSRKQAEILFNYHPNHGKR